MIYNDQKVATDRVGKKLEVKSVDWEYDEGIDDPYLDVARENAEAVELRNEAERLTQHND